MSAHGSSLGYKLVLVGQWLVHVGDSRLTVLDPATGRLVWTGGAPGGSALHSAVVGADKLYVLTSTGRLFEVAWSPPFPAVAPSWRALSPPAGMDVAALDASEGVLLLSGYLGHGVAALDPRSDRILWRRSARAGEASIPCLLPGGVVHLSVQQISTGAMEEMGLSLRDGRLLYGPWAADGIPVLVGSSGTNAVLATHGRAGVRISLVESRSGSVLWSWAAQGAYATGRRYAGVGPDGSVWSLEGMLFRLEAATGRPLTVYPLPQRGLTALLLRIAADHVLLLEDGASLSGDGPSDASFVTRLDLATGQTASVEILPRGSTLDRFTVIPGGFVLLTSDGRVRAFRG